MSWLADLVKAVNPCIHQYRVISTLPNRKKDPTAVTVVRCCDICGDLETTVVKSEPPPDDGVHHHKWKNIQRITVYKNGTDPKDIKNLPLRYDYDQQCEGCGDVRTVRGGT